MADDRQKCLSAGCTDYLTKPVDKHKLLQAVGKYLRSKQGETVSADSQLPAPGDDVPIRSIAADDEDVSQFLPAFIAQLPATAVRLLALLRKGEMTSLTRLIHQLKGTLGLYGFPDICERAAGLEERMNEGEKGETVVADVNGLVTMLRRIEGYDTKKEQILDA